MKYQVTRKYIKGLWSNIYQCNYCSLYFLFYAQSPSYYNSGVYGWNFDCYTDYNNDIAITAGYRNTIGKKIPYELCNKYNKLAKNIVYNSSYDDFTKEHDLSVLQDKFYNELLAL